ncbi:MAG: M14 family metallopeptidase, partial [Spirochaetia bacterium]
MRVFNFSFPPSGGLVPPALVIVAAMFLTAAAHISFAQSGSGEHRAAGSSGEVIGHSVEGRPITVERVGSGPIDVLIVGGIHGAYEANSIVLARRFLEYHRTNPRELPEEFTLHVIDNMNPDGVHRVTGGTPVEEFDFRTADTAPGRFNARWVDLNRNWDGDWQPTSYWGNREVDAGSAPFSEPETRTVRDYVERIDPAVSVFYQSAAFGLWYSGAEHGWEPARRLAEAYHEASGYRLPRADEDTGETDGPID